MTVTFTPTSVEIRLNLRQELTKEQVKTLSHLIDRHACAYFSRIKKGKSIRKTVPELHPDSDPAIVEPDPVKGGFPEVR